MPFQLGQNVEIISVETLARRSGNRTSPLAHFMLRDFSVAGACIWLSQGAGIRSIQRCPERGAYGCSQWTLRSVYIIVPISLLESRVYCVVVFEHKSTGVRVGRS